MTTKKAVTAKKAEASQEARLASSREFVELALNRAQAEQPHDGSELERKYANYIEALKALVSMAYGLTY